MPLAIYGLDDDGSLVITVGDVEIDAPVEEIAQNFADTTSKLIVFGQRPRSARMNLDCRQLRRCCSMMGPDSGCCQLEREHCGGIVATEIPDLGARVVYLSPQVSPGAFADYAKRSGYVFDGSSFGDIVRDIRLYDPNAYAGYADGPEDDHPCGCGGKCGPCGSAGFSGFWDSIGKFFKGAAGWVAGVFKKGRNVAQDLNEWYKRFDQAGRGVCVTDPTCPNVLWRMQGARDAIIVAPSTAAACAGMNVVSSTTVPGWVSPICPRDVPINPPSTTTGGSVGASVSSFLSQPWVAPTAVGLGAVALALVVSRSRSKQRRAA